MFYCESKLFKKNFPPHSCLAQVLGQSDAGRCDLLEVADAGIAVQKSHGVSQENAEFQQIAASRASQLASLSLDFETQKQDVARLQSAHDALARNHETHEAELRWYEQSWSSAALKERSAKRSFYVKLAGRISLAVASLAFAFAAVQIAAKYWSYTQQDHLRMLHKATQEHAQAAAALSEARRTLVRIPGHVNIRSGVM